MKHPWSQLLWGAGPALAEDCPNIAQNLGLHKELLEGRMGDVRAQIPQDNLRVARDVQRPGHGREIRDAHPAQFHIVRGGHRDVGLHLDIVIATLK
jgi:hypothetical protein